MGIFSNLTSRFRTQGYEAARAGRDRPMAWQSGAMPVDEDKQVGSMDRATIRNEARNLRRNHPLVSAIVERISDNVVSTGNRPFARTSNEGFNTAAENYFAKWARHADHRRRVDFTILSKLAIEHVIIDGEVFFLLTDATPGRLQPIEPERVATPKDWTPAAPGNVIVEGIEHTHDGVPVRYFVCDRDANGYVNTATGKPYGADVVIHLMRPGRFDMCRGVSLLAPVINLLKDQADLQKNILKRARIEARSGFVVTGKSGASKIANAGPRNAGQNPVTKQRFESFEGGAIMYLDESESVTQAAITTPGGSYVGYNEALVKSIGAAIGLPIQYLLADYDVSFSAAKAGLAQVYRLCLGWHAWLTAGLHDRAWRFVIGSAISNKSLPIPPKDAEGVSEYARVEWSKPDYMAIDPNDAGLANIYAFSLGSTSLDDICGRSGKDKADVLAAKKDDYIVAARMAAEANKELAALGLPDRLSIGHFIRAQIPPTPPDTTPTQSEAATAAAEATPATNV